MKQNLLVSIVVPVFNSEEHLSRCIESILNQTYKNIEVLLINDGSTDYSRQICEYYMKLDRRIQVFNQDNSGPATARNKGINYAKGEFIQFVDSDDYILPNMTEALIRSAIQEDIGYVLCGYYRQVNGSKVKISPREEGNFSTKAFLNNLAELYKDILLPSTCNKLYSLNIIKRHNLSFREKVDFGEDLLFNLAYIDHYQRAILIKDPLYVYVHNKRSLSNTYYPNYFSQQLYVINQVEELLSKHGRLSIENKRNLNVIYFRGIVNSLSNIFAQDSPLSKGERLGEIRKIIKHEKTISLQYINKSSLQARILSLLLNLRSVHLIYFMFSIKEWFKNTRLYKG